MTRLAVIALAVLFSPAAVAQTNVSGDWATEFSTRYGRGSPTMTLAQDGTRLTGYLSAERGEIPLKGTIEGNKFQIVWEQPVEGKVIQITFTGIVKGNTMTGTVRFGDLAEGPFYAERR